VSYAMPAVPQFAGTSGFKHAINRSEPRWRPGYPPGNNEAYHQERIFTNR
jgi:hypothetical protein